MKTREQQLVTDVLDSFDRYRSRNSSEGRGKLRRHYRRPKSLRMLVIVTLARRVGLKRSLAILAYLANRKRRR
jgi:hypothetical protein